MATADLALTAPDHAQFTVFLLDVPPGDRTSIDAYAAAQADRFASASGTQQLSVEGILAGGTAGKKYVFSRATLGLTTKIAQVYMILNGKALTLSLTVATSNPEASFEADDAAFMKIIETLHVEGR